MAKEPEKEIVCYPVEILKRKDEFGREQIVEGIVGLPAGENRSDYEIRPATLEESEKTKSRLVAVKRDKDAIKEEDLWNGNLNP